MAELRGTDAIVHCLKAMRVQRVYGVIGTSIVGFLDGLYEARDTIRYISCRHEQVAASMADAEGRLTRRPGVVALHSGPGSLNAMISLANAAKDCSPVIAITGSIKRRLQGCDGMLELDHVRVFRPICRAAVRIEDVRRIPHIFTQAWQSALDGPGGPVLIEVPEDVWADRDDIPMDSLDVTLPVAALVPTAKVEEIRDRLMRAARPLFLAGAGVSYSHSQDVLRLLAERLRIPVVTTGNGRGAISELHPLSLGRAGYGGGNPVADEAMRQADFILAMGCTVSDITTYEYSWRIQADIVAVNLDRDNESKPIPMEAAYGDAGRFLKDLATAVAARTLDDRRGWIDDLQPQREAWRNLLASARQLDGRPVSPTHVCDRLAALLREDAVITVGAGLHLLYPMAFLPCRQPLTFLSAVNFGAMGFGFPAALAAKLVHSDREVIAILGDGDFMMTVQDLETAAREKIAVRVFIVNDNAYRVLAFRQQAQWGNRIYGTQHSNPDFCKLAESFGVPAWRISEASQIDQTLAAALGHAGPSLVEIVTDPSDLPPTNLEAALRM
jgi:acetolactate synthase-1/2/3 large subunit